jgi:hypothetical protein
MPNSHHCVLTEAESLWRQHGETLSNGSHHKKELASCELWGLNYIQAVTFHQRISQASEDMNLIRESFVARTEAPKSFGEIIQFHADLLAPFFTDPSCKLERDLGEQVTVTLGKDFLLSLMKQYAHSIDLMRTNMDQYQSISDVASECAHVAERIELSCQVLDDEEILESLEDGIAEPLMKSVAVQYAHEELPLPSFFCLETAQELIRSGNVEMITLMLRLILESAKKLMHSNRESFPVMRESIEDAAKKSISIQVAKEKEELQRERQQHRRAALSVVK